MPMAAVFRDLSILAELLGLPLFSAKVDRQLPPETNRTGMASLQWDGAGASATFLVRAVDWDLS